MPGPMMGGPYGGGLWMVLHFLVWVILLAGLILLIVWIIKRVGRIEGEHGGEISRGETALDVLKKRYARGEISKEDFDRMKKDIS
ncbi:MAG: SHOCT domain-containing protein [Nitrospiraceae bacterium]|nr:SHOCT domain-containing protein [Nitrospiraceae bacterium]